MPQPGYEWLTKREQTFLDNPDQFDAQTSAEIRYRLREKHRATVEAVNALRDQYEKWDTKEPDGEQTATCLECGETRDFPQYRYRETDETEIRVDDWYLVETPKSDSSRWVTMGSPDGWCASCWKSIREKGRELALERGLIVCSYRECSIGHKLYSAIVRGKGEDSHEHFPYIPFDQSEINVLYREHRQMRQPVCPECGREKTKIPTGTVEALAGNVNNWEDPETYETDGWRCPCGWCAVDSSDFRFARRPSEPVNGYRVVRSAST